MNFKHILSFCCFSLRNWWTAWNRNDSFQISPLRWVIEFINKLVIWIILVNNCLWWTYSKSNNLWSWTICQNRRPLHDHSFVVIIIIILLYIIHHPPLHYPSLSSHYPPILDPSRWALWVGSVPFWSLPCQLAAGEEKCLFFWTTNGNIRIWVWILYLLYIIIIFYY